MARIKPAKPIFWINSWDEADKTLSEIATLRARINETVAKYNAKEQDTRMKEVTLPNSPLEERLKVLENSLEAFACDNRGDFGKLKSKELNHGIVSFRVGMPRVAQIAKYTVNATIQLIKNSIWKNDLIRTKEEVDKDTILAQIKNPESGLNADVLREFGLEVKQDETFGYELKNAAEKVE
ncbi:MAG: host-nuclease inhibitor Gam family protein [Bacteroidetes bacterium]|nr:host-nuclease inhibitor Gam family protein [Bacteroidota bacterium]